MTQVKDEWKMEVIWKIEDLQTRLQEIWGSDFSKSWRKDLEKIRARYIYTPVSYGELHDDIKELKEWARIAETELDKK